MNNHLWLQLTIEAPNMWSYTHPAQSESPTAKKSKIQSDITSIIKNNTEAKQLSELHKKRDTKPFIQKKKTKPKPIIQIYLSISAACFAWACKFVFYKQWFHCISLLKYATKKFSVLSIIFIDAHIFTHSGFPSLALNVLLKDYLIAQLQAFWNSTQKSLCQEQNQN